MTEERVQPPPTRGGRGAPGVQMMLARIVGPENCEHTIPEAVEEFIPVSAIVEKAIVPNVD